MTENPFDKPLIVQSDRTVLMDIHSSLADEARAHLACFAELVKSPEHIHTYRLSPLSIWNACATGISADDMVKTLKNYAKYPPPEAILSDVINLADRYGCVLLVQDGSDLKLQVRDLPTAELLSRDKSVSRWIGKWIEPLLFIIHPVHRGVLKQALVQIGYPADDQAGYVDGLPLSIELRKADHTGTLLLNGDTL